MITPFPSALFALDTLFHAARPPLANRDRPLRRRVKMTTNKQQHFETEAMPHMSALYGMALKYTHNETEAEDLVQDALIKAYNSFNSYEEGTNCRAWLFRILTNTFINKYRRSKRERAYVDKVLTEYLEDSSLTSESADKSLESLETEEATSESFAFSDEIIHALNAISNEFKSIVILADLQEMSYKEIAEKLHIPLGTVMSRLFRGRQMLKKSLTTYAAAAGYC